MTDAVLERLVTEAGLGKGQGLGSQVPTPVFGSLHCSPSPIECTFSQVKSAAGCTEYKAKVARGTRHSG